MEEEKIEITGEQILPEEIAEEVAEEEVEVGKKPEQASA